MSPIRPSEREKYPADWKAISARIRARAGDRCECQGECGLHPPNPLPRRCEERQGAPARWAKGKVVLTTAHLDHQPEHVENANLRAFCQRCHLRYDSAHHQRNAAATRRARKRNGELYP